MRAGFVALVLIVGCKPDADGSEGAGSESGSSSTGSDSGSSSTSSESDSEASGDTGVQVCATDTPEQSPCSAFTDEASCLAASCAAFEPVQPLVYGPPGCVIGPVLWMCFESAEPDGAWGGAQTPEGYFRCVDGVPEVIQISFTPVPPPVGWIRCSGAPEDPPACVCKEGGP